MQRECRLGADRDQPEASEARPPSLRAEPPSRGVPLGLWSLAEVGFVTVFGESSPELLCGTG